MRMSSAVVLLIGAASVVVGCSATTAPAAPTAPSASTVVSSADLSATAPNPVPFKGSLEGTDADSNPTATTIDVTTDGTGNGTHLGQFKFHQTVTLCFAGACAGTTYGTSHWEAADGDSFDTTLTGSGQPTGNPGEFRIWDIHTITAGTGRFAEATGSFTVDRVASGITFLTSGSFDGSMTSPGAAK